MEQPSYYAVIPANVRYDKRLSSTAKLLYGEITALTNKEGYCWANNAYFADLYGCAGITISRLISSLSANGYISVEVDHKKGNKRSIYLLSKMMLPIIKNDKRGLIKNDKPYTNTTSTNNKYNKEIHKERLSFNKLEGISSILTRKYPGAFNRT